MSEKPQRVIVPLPGCVPEIGIALAMIEDCRARTRNALRDLNPAAVDRVDGLNGHSIGTLLFHIAAIEIDWLATEVLEGKAPDSIWAYFPHEVRDEQGKLTSVMGVNLDDHWKRLDVVRGLLLETFKAMSLDEYRRVRELEQYDVTPEWVLHHLMQHEAEHRDEMISLRAAAEKS